MTFATNPALNRALTERGYTELTPVQEAVLEAGAEARDLLVSAQTGSGKTVAYGLAFAPTLLGGEERFERPGLPKALVIAPTRELAMQVHRELSWLYAQTGARIVSCIGGMDGQREARALEAGAPYRGRHARPAVRPPGARPAETAANLPWSCWTRPTRCSISASATSSTQLLDATPEWRRTLLFSATIAREITALARKYQKDALRIDTLVRNQPHADIEYRAVRVPPRETEHAVVNVLRYFEAPTALVFCATRDGVAPSACQPAGTRLHQRGAVGRADPDERTRALQAMRDGQARVCVATDVAARGLDLPDLGLVIHADLPTNKQTLLHRSGRTGRAGRKGTCVLIVPAQSRARGRGADRRRRGFRRTGAARRLPRKFVRATAQRLLQDPVADRGNDTGRSGPGTHAAGRPHGRGDCGGPGPAVSRPPARS